MNRSRRRFIQTMAASGLSTTLFGSSWAHPSIRERESLDLCLKGGTMIDGTGAPARRTDIGIRDGVIVTLGDLSNATAERTIDSTGLVVTPGFIDIHSHVDLELFRDPRAESKIRQGVTTEVTGCDGMSVAPLGGPGLEKRLEEFSKEFGFDCPYRTMDGFFSALEKKRTAQNLLSLVGLGTVRGVVIGKENRPATPDELRAMQRLVEDAIEQGCWGTSSGLEYTPGAFASTEELTSLVSVVPERFRIYATHMRNEDNRLLEAIEESITIARGAGARLQVSHLKASYKVNWPKQRKALEMLEQAEAGGMTVRADRYPYIAYATDLSALFPLWSREGGSEKFLERLRDPSLLPSVQAAVETKISSLGSWDSIMISDVKTDELKPFMGKTLREIGEALEIDPFDAALQILFREEGDAGMVGFGMDEAGTEMVLRWPHTVVASDAGSASPSHPTYQPHPRAYGTFPRAIALYQRERNLMSLPEMIRKMTSMPAAMIGLRDRGTIAEGMAADLVVFDENTIRDRATFVNPHQFPDGIPYVIVNGVPVVDQNVQGDLFPGKILRSSSL